MSDWHLNERGLYMAETIETYPFEYKGKNYESQVRQTDQGVEVGVYHDGKLASLSYTIIWETHKDCSKSLEKALPVLIQFAKQEITGTV